MVYLFVWGVWGGGSRGALQLLCTHASRSHSDCSGACVAGQAPPKCCGRL